MKALKCVLSMAILIIAVGGCSKDSAISKDPVIVEENNPGKLIEVKSWYQSYTNGSISTSKKEWEYWKYDNSGKLLSSKTYETYSYDNSSGYPITKVFTYDTDGTVNHCNIEQGASKFTKKYYYNMDKSISSEEDWINSRLMDTHTFTYKEGKISEIHTDNWFAIYKYDAKSLPVTIDYFRSDKKPWVTHTYTYDDRGSLTKKSYHSLETGARMVYYTAAYEYDNKGRVSKKTFRDGIGLDFDYEVVSQYNDKDQLLSQKIRTISNAVYSDWMYITYDYTYQ
ncbi:hypothetical protein [Sphingobacterium corticibacter]|uniref:DUF4595 domain-containing protein n=1 Tax=Sphingobacterium corticibacter TaxID=2171749 RepID=A0A2T8HI70_9SPHI|nr:hypothetical protein [Sphingobacterium corticibacter]PVH25146.1 hypothetical protein DC487_09450 [Sphingobacterium corticibacter]